MPTSLRMTSFDSINVDDASFTYVDIPDLIEGKDAAALMAETEEFVRDEPVSDSTNDYPGVQFYTVGGDGSRSETPIPSFGN